MSGGDRRGRTGEVGKGLEFVVVNGEDWQAKLGMARRCSAGFGGAGEAGCGPDVLREAWRGEAGEAKCAMAGQDLERQAWKGKAVTGKDRQDWQGTAGPRWARQEWLSPARWDAAMCTAAGKAWCGDVRRGLLRQVRYGMAWLADVRHGQARPDRRTKAGTGMER